MIWIHPGWICVDCVVSVGSYVTIKIDAHLNVYVPNSAVVAPHSIAWKMENLQLEIC